jgi:transcriptional regulator with XRE-family HTH domain
MRGALGNRVLGLRGENKWKREELAVKAGVCSNTVGKIERGETAHIKLSTLKKLAQTFDVTVSELLEGE